LDYGGLGGDRGVWGGLEQLVEGDVFSFGAFYCWEFLFGGLGGWNLLFDLLEGVWKILVFG
jgi:hypothetical protein